MTKTTIKRGAARKPPETVQRMRMVTCNDLLWDQLCELAEARGVSRAELLRTAIAEFLERERNA